MHLFFLLNFIFTAEELVENNMTFAEVSKYLDHYIDKHINAIDTNIFFTFNMLLKKIIKLHKNSMKICDEKLRDFFTYYFELVVKIFNEEKLILILLNKTYFIDQTIKMAAQGNYIDYYYFSDLKQIITAQRKYLNDILITYLEKLGENIPYENKKQLESLKKYWDDNFNDIRYFTNNLYRYYFKKLCLKHVIYYY